MTVHRLVRVPLRRSQPQQQPLPIIKHRFLDLIRIDTVSRDMLHSVRPPVQPPNPHQLDVCSLLIIAYHNTLHSSSGSCYKRITIDSPEFQIKRTQAKRPRASSKTGLRHHTTGTDLAITAQRRAVLSGMLDSLYLGFGRSQCGHDGRGRPISLGVTQLNGAIFRHGCLPRLDSISSRRYSGPS